MILTHSVRVCLATAPCDMRKSFNSLSNLVTHELGEDPLSRTVFVFINRRADRVKLLYWNGTGLWVLAKRLEKGGFSRPPSSHSGRSKIHLKPEALEMLLSGTDLKDGMARVWYEERK